MRIQNASFAATRPPPALQAAEINWKGLALNGKLNAIAATLLLSSYTALLTTVLLTAWWKFATAGRRSSKG
jgi:hypothetical protein